MSGKSRRVNVTELRRRFALIDGHLRWIVPTRGPQRGSEVGWWSLGYRRVRFGGRSYFVHHIVWAMTYGSWPQSELDHINGDKADNRIENLREVSRSENMLNRGPTHSNTSGYKGVSWSKAARKWTAQLGTNYVHKHLGCFESPAEAHVAYSEALKAACGKQTNRQVATFVRSMSQGT